MKIALSLVIIILILYLITSNDSHTIVNKNDAAKEDFSVLDYLQERRKIALETRKIAEEAKKTAIDKIKRKNDSNVKPERENIQRKLL